MEKKEVKRLLQRYFDGESTSVEERALQAYFQSGDVAEEWKEYIDFFGGISESATTDRDEKFEEEIMDFILENESKEKNRYRGLWQKVTGIAASVILVIGGMLLYQQRNQSFEDTFDDPEAAYAYAEQTLGYVSAKYNKGLAALSNFNKLQTATQPLQKGIEPVNEYLELIETIGSGEKNGQ